VAISTTLGGLLGISLVTLLLQVSTVAWSLAGAAAGEVASLVYIWATALRILRDAPVAATPGRPASYAPRMPEWHV
jgi:hypothetical protein